MRILCVGNLFPNPLRPVRGIFNWRQWSEMARRTPLRVISPVPWTEELHAWRKGLPAFADGSWREWDGVPVAYCRYYYLPRVLRRYYGQWFEASIRECFSRAVGEFRPDVVLASWAYPDGWATARLAREFGLPVVLKIHGSDLLQLDKFPGRQQRTREVMQMVDCLFTVSRDLRNRAIQLGAPEEFTHAIHEGTDCELFTPGDQRAARLALSLPLEGERLLFVGNLVEVKGIPFLIEACRQLVHSGRPLRLDIIGAGPLRASLARQIAASGLRDFVRLRGSRHPAELPQWYRAADLVVLPSHSEGIPNVLVEAAACGRPFVATAVGGIPEIAHFSRSELVPPADSAALAQAISRMLDDAARGAPALNRALIPSNRNSVSAQLKIFAELLASRHVDLSADEPDAGAQDSPVEPLGAA